MPLSYFHAIVRVRTEPRFTALASALLSSLPNTNDINDILQSRLAQRLIEAADAIDTDRSSLLTRIESLERDLTSTRLSLANANSTNAFLRTALTDFADHGLRCDLTPTMNFSDTQNLYTHFTHYLSRVNDSVRLRARESLAKHF